MLQLGLELLALTDVAGNGGKVGDVAVLVTVRHDHLVQVDGLPVAARQYRLALPDAVHLCLAKCTADQLAGRLGGAAVRLDLGQQAVASLVHIDHGACGIGNSDDVGGCLENGVQARAVLVGLDPLADIASRRDKVRDLACLVNQRRDDFFLKEGRAVVLAVYQGAAVGLLAQHRFPQFGIGGGVLLLRLEYRGRAASDRLCVVAGHLLKGGVNVLELALAVGNEDAVGCLLDCLGQFAQHVLGQPVSFLQRLIGDGALNHRRQTAKVMLDHIVLGTAFDGGYGGLFT